jgi:hypothetical protein
MQEMFYEAGWLAYPLLLAALTSTGIGLLAVVLAAAKALRPALMIAGLATGIAFVGVLGGRFGYLDGLRGAYRAVAHAHPDDRQTILAASEREARSSLALGLLSLPGGLLGVVAVGISFARTRGRP